MSNVLADVLLITEYLPWGPNLDRRVSYSTRSRLEFPDRQLRKDESQIATDEGVHEPPGMNPELLVLAAADD